MDMASLNTGLQSLATNPLFNLGLGMLSTPYQRTPVSFGQVLGNGVSQMDYAQQQAAQAQTRQMQAQLLQQQVREAHAKQTQADAQSKYISTLPADQQALATADPGAYVGARVKLDDANPWVMDEKDGVLVNPRTGQFKPITGVPSATGVSVPPTVPRVGVNLAALPPETQQYVPKVLGALNGAAPFDASGQPTPALLAAVQHVESGGNPNAVSPAGAQGAFQMMPPTAASVGVTNPFDPTQERAGAARYLAQQYARFGNPQAAIAAYNAGPGRVAAATGAAQPMPAQGGTPDTLAAYRAARAAASGFQMLSQDQVKTLGLPAGTIAQRGPNGQIHVVSKGGEVPDEQSLSQLDPQTQALVKKVASYEVMPSNLSNYVRPGQGLTRQQILGYAALLNPDYNINNAEAANAYLKDMAKSSPTSIGGQTQSLNMILHHLGPMMQANSALSGSGVRLFNEAKNTFESHFNGNTPAGAAPGNWDQGKTFVSQELGKLLKGGVASEAEVKDLESGLDAAKSPYQRSQALYNVADYVYGKIQAMSDRRSRLLGGMAPKTSLLDSQAEKNLIGAYKLGGRDAPELLAPGTNYATGAIANPQAAQAIPPQAIMYLKSHPGTRAQFDAQFGAGAAAKALGN